MRGKAEHFPPEIMRHRITPAYAGKSCYRNLIAVDPRDHPRLCGEKKSISSCQHTALGSPPPMRGKVETLYTELSRVGITPAYAGKSRNTLYRIVKSWDHPRLCGEKFFFFDSQHLRIRITPAYAGKSHCSISQTPRVKDHPRLCGEKFSTYM